MSHSLKTCIVHHSNSRSIGLLFIENERVVVLLNNLIEKANLGALEDIRNEHMEPEAFIMIIPRNQVKNIHILQEFE